MSFTDDPWVRVEALIDGAWVDIAADMDDDDGGGRISGTKGVTLTHGRSPGAQRANSRTATYDIFNRDGKYASRNPRSPYWGLLPLNTPCRVTALPYESYLAIHSPDGFVPAWAPDSATLDITGDLEFWIDLEPEQIAGVHAYTVVGKWNGTGNQYSWLFFLYQGKPILWWTPDGTFANARNILVNTAVPDGRISLKVRLDVNNGAGAAALSVFTAESIDGTYTQLGSTTTSAGTTSLFNSTADLTIGTDHGGTVGLQYNNGERFQGKIYQFRLYAGIAGALRATADFTNLEYGDDQYSDGTTTWLINTPTTYIASDKIRFYGYIPKWPVTAANKANRYSPIKAHGLFNVLSQGALDLDSPMRRFYVTVPTMIGYWPCEDGQDSTRISASDTRTRPASAVDVTYASQGDLPGSKDLLVLSDTSKIQGRFRAYTNTSEWAFAFCVYTDATPAADVNLIYITTSNGMTIKFMIGTTTYRTDIYDQDGVSLSSQNTLFGTNAEPGQWLAFVYEFTQSGGNIVWSLNWRGVTPNVAYAHGSTFAGTLGKLAGWTADAIPAAANLNTVALGHVAGDSTVDVFLEEAHIDSFRGYVGETDVARLIRLCGEENIALIVKGKPADGTPMGKQSIKTLMGLFDDCASAGTGVLIETRFSPALMYVTRNELSRYFTRDIDMASEELLEAILDDDIEPVNYVTVTRDEGGSSTAITTEGPRAVTEIGTLGDPQTLNLYEDSQTRDTAEWIRHLGSWDEDRWFGLQFELAKSVIADDPLLLDMFYGLDLLHGIRLINPPDYLTVREPECLIDEYTEVLTRPSHALTISTSPAKPYATAQWLDARVRVGSSASRVSTAINSSTTSLVVKSASPYTVWTFSSSFYISVGNDKEKMLVTGISGTASPWTFTVSRGTPAFSHAVDDTVRLWDARVIGH